ncbi:MAG TPA: hypothetical protein VGI24_00925 [Solirubrobacteraceae bacterium]
MKRNLLTAMGVATLALAMPGAALAHGHHHHHHGVRPNAHHAKFRMVHIGPVSPTTTPPSPTTTPAPQNAGTVTSYTNGVLTLTLNDNSTVSGKVTNETRIGCVKASPTPPTSSEPGDEGPGDDRGQGDDQERGDMNEQHGDHGQGDWWHGDGPGAGEPEPPCDSSSLVPGAVVRAAELRIGPAGTEFESILLVR